MARMTVREKVAQLSGVWLLAADAGEMAPMLHDAEDLSWEDTIADGLGQLTRPFGTSPVEVEQGLAALADRQAQVRAANRFAIPAQVHEECLTGLNAWQATIYPTPVSWAASFDPALVERMGRQIGGQLRAPGDPPGPGPGARRDARPAVGPGRGDARRGPVPRRHHGLGLRARRAVRRGRRDPQALPRLLRLARRTQPGPGRDGSARAGRRDAAAVRDGPARRRAVGDELLHRRRRVPSAADAHLLTTLLRDTLGFEGTVAADYFSVAFLHTLHAMASDLGDAARLALEAGIDVELPTVDAYGEPCSRHSTAGRVDEKLVDRACRRVLRQKCELGLLDPGWAPVAAEPVDLDPPEARALASSWPAARWCCWPTTPAPPAARGGPVALVGPNADTARRCWAATRSRCTCSRTTPTPARRRDPDVLEALSASRQVVHERGAASCAGHSDEPRRPRPR